MTAVRLPRLSRPGVLESIANDRLFALLRPYADFFASRAVPIETPDSIDCQAVIREITKADRDTPSDLLDAISLIDELANAVAVELLLDRVPAHTLGIELGGKHSPADIVTAAWLSTREKLIQAHALSRIKRVRSYDYFQASQTTAPKFVTPAEETLQQLERDIDSWHVERFRAQGTKVEIFEKPDEVEFSIMHGSLYRRQQVVENGRFGIQSFWPVQSASAIYNREFGELRINAKTAREKALYCRLLGKHMFGNEDLFPTGVKYTLDPLREHEFAALAPGSIEGISDVRMIELWLGDPDDRYGVITIRKGDDLLDWAQAKKKNIWLERRLISATFKMELLRPKRELAITVRPPNVAMYSRGPVAAIIEAWLMSNFPAWVFDAEREEAPRFTPTIGFRLVEQAKNPSSVDDGKFDVIRHFQDVGFSAVFGDNALETRKVALLSELMIGVKIGVLDFDVSDKDAVYDSAFRQAQDRFEGIVLRVSDERMKQVLKIVDLAIRKELQHEGHLRINVMLPIDNSRLQVAYSFNMDGTLDTDDRLILGRDQGASGACWRDLEAIACNLEEARVTYADVWRMDKYQQCLVRKSLKSLLSVPLFSPNANSLEEGFVGVLNFDSDEQLFDSFTRLGQNDEDGYLLSCTQMIAERLTNWRLV